MDPKTITHSKLQLNVETSQRTLPDESDQIISELEQELKTLRQKLQLQESQSTSPQASSKENETETQKLHIQLQIKRHQLESLIQQHEQAKQQASLLPHMMDQMQKPVAQINANLDNLIGHIQDAEVQKALKQCQNIAVAAMKQAQQVETKSRRLQSHQEMNRDQVDILSFFKSVTSKEDEHVVPEIKVKSLSSIPQHFYVDQELFSEAILTLLKEIAKTSGDDLITITLKQGDESVYDITVQHLEVALFGESPWNVPSHIDLPGLIEASKNNSQDMGLDLMHAQKVLEMHGGTLGLHREAQQVCGFKITLPTSDHDKT